MLKKIDNFEYSSLFILNYLSSSIGLSLYTAIKYAGLDSYIGIAFSFISGIIPLIIFIILLNYKPDLNIKDKIVNVFGKILGTIINYLLVILFIGIASTIIFNLSNFIVSQYLSDTNILYIMITLGITLYFTLNKGIETISRISFLFLIIFIILFMIAIFAESGQFHLDNLKPYLEYGLKGSIKVGLVNSLLTFMPCFSLLVIDKDNIKKNDKTIKYIIISYIAAAIILFLISVLSTSILGGYLIQIYQYPAYISLKKASLFNFIDRIENFFSLDWILSCFTAITMSLYYVKESITKKKNNVINILLISIIIIVAYKVFKNNTIFDKYIISYYPYLLLSMLVIFTMIAIIILIKKLLNKCIKNKI